MFIQLAVPFFSSITLFLALINYKYMLNILIVSLNSNESGLISIFADYWMRKLAYSAMELHCLIVKFLLFYKREYISFSMRGQVHG